jgi:peroxiredoxin
VDGAVFLSQGSDSRLFAGVELSTFLIDPRGIVDEVWRGVKVAGHVEAVTDELKKHQAADT